MRQQRAVGGGKVMSVLISFLVLFSPALGPSSWAHENQEPDRPPLKLKSETTAVALSTLGTIIPVGLLLNAMFNANEPDTPVRTALTRSGLIALLFGPSLGLFYAGAVNRGFSGIGLRLAGMGAMVGAMALAWDSSSDGAALLIGQNCKIGDSILFSQLLIRKMMYRHQFGWGAIGSKRRTARPPCPPSRLPPPPSAGA
jgi:hypothetical protein